MDRVPADMAALSRTLFLLALADGVLVFWALVLFWYRWRVLSAPPAGQDAATLHGDGE